MNTKKLVTHYRLAADFYERQTEWCKEHAPIQSMAQCPGCAAWTRGGQVCPACLRAVADVLEAGTANRRTKSGE